MPENKHDKKYYALLLLAFILVFAFGVVVGCYVCTGGNSGDLTVNVENDGGNPLSNVSVAVTENGSQVANGTTNGAGQVNFEDLPNGNYTVTATLGNGNSVVSNSTNVVISGSNEETTIVLPGFDGQDPFKLLG